MKNRGFLVALVATAVLFAFACRPAPAAPALWLVQSPGGGKAYLFGTVHLLRPGTRWRSPELDAAIQESQDLYLEIADPTNPASVSPVFKLGFDRAHPLSTKISQDDVQQLDAAAKRYGFGGEAVFEPMQPWLAYMMLIMMPATHGGYSTGKGVDVNVRKDFVAAGKPVHGFETMEQQAHIFADMSQPMQVALLESEIKSLNAKPGGDAAGGTAGETGSLDAIVDAWMSGDEDQLAATLHLNKSGTMYAPLIADRNKAWAEVLAMRLKQPGTSFVSVGAAHLVGPDGVPALLEKMGFTVTRVAIAPEAPSASPAASPESSAAPEPSPAATDSAPPPPPATIVAPQGWKSRPSTLVMGPLKTETMWVDPNGGGVLLTAHLDEVSAATQDLASMDALFHQGMVAAAGDKNVTPSTRIKICGEKQDATYTKVTLENVKEDIVLTFSGRAYLVEYVRKVTATDDPAAIRAMRTLCAPAP